MLDDSQQQNSNLDYILRTLESNQKDGENRLDRVERFLNDWQAWRIAAFDEVGNPWIWEVLSKRSGAWPGIAGTTQTYPFNVTDKSAGGAHGIISVLQGTVTDLTNSSTVWGSTPNNIYINDPVYGNVPFNVPVGGRAPELQLNSAATVVYLNATVNSTTGYITAMQILGDTGAGMPASTSTQWNELIANLTVTITSGVAKVNIPQPQSLLANLYFAICNPLVNLPLTDGTFYRVGT